MSPRYPPAYFNPRSREGSDTAVCDPLFPFFISIHAPAKGATQAYDYDYQMPDISIHAPAKGATMRNNNEIKGTLFQSTLPRRERRSMVFPGLLSSGDFNPRSREGSDGVMQGNDKFLPRISIHAPAKGATAARTPEAAGLQLFQSMLPAREQRERMWISALNR